VRNTKLFAAAIYAATAMTGFVAGVTLFSELAELAAWLGGAR
jgi:hypothetical protein